MVRGPWDNGGKVEGPPVPEKSTTHALTRSPLFKSSSQARPGHPVLQMARARACRGRPVSLRFNDDEGTIWTAGQRRQFGRKPG